MGVIPPARPRPGTLWQPLCASSFDAAWGRPTYANCSLERTGCPRLLLFSAGACKAVDQATFSTGRHCGTGF